MFYEIENCCKDRPVFVVFNSRATLHLAPGTSKKVPDVEVSKNRRIEKLVARGIIKCHEVKKKGPPSGPKKGKKKSKKGKK
jgi:hypothetical protein